MPLPETLDCHSCGREAALDAEMCPCGASFDPLLRASEAALESLEHKEDVVLGKDLVEDPTESGYRRSRLGKPKGQNNDYRLSAAFFEEDEKEGADRTRSSFFDRSAPQFEFDISTSSLEKVSLSSLKNVSKSSFNDVSLTYFSGVSVPSFGVGDGETEEDERERVGTDCRELHLREYDDHYTLHWDAHSATSPMHAVKDAPDYGAACVAAAGVVAAAVGSRVVKRRRSSSPDE